MDTPRPRLSYISNKPATRRGKVKRRFLLCVALLIFGPKNLPKLGKMFGKTISGFKKGMEEPEDSDDSEEKAEKKAAKKDEDEE